jgi:hypothetical protein
VAAAFTGACELAPGPRAADQPAAFSLQASGGESLALRGMVLVLPTRPADYVETNPRTGGRSTWDVTPVLLTASVHPGGSDPYLSVGLLGTLHAGTYQVRRTLTPASSDREFVAEIVVPDADGWANHYLIDGGEFVVNSVRPFLSGTLTMHASQVVRLSANPAVGTSFRSTPSTLTVTAAFGEDPPTVP